MIVACTGVQEALLREEFPSLTFIELRGYEIRYDKNRALTILQLLCAIPKILIRIKRENTWLGHFAVREGLDLVISDNRYGLALRGIPCIFITHQLLIKTPWGGLADRLLQWMNYRAISRFSRCWVPDIAAGGLAGELSHPAHMPSIPTRYIGWLSRFDSPAVHSGDVAQGLDADAVRLSDPGPAGLSEPAPVRLSDPAAVRLSDPAPARLSDLAPVRLSKPDPGPGSSPAPPCLLVLLSGPEPQRSVLENEILRQAEAMTKTPPACRIVIVRGLPGGNELPAAAALPSWLTLHNHLPASTLEPLLLGASLVLARPGYSTVMDLERLGKRALFIPTPGQTEQEYLGPYLASKSWAECVDQHALSLSKALGMAVKAGISRERQPEDPDLLAREIEAVLSSLEDAAE